MPGSKGIKSHLDKIFLYIFVFISFDRNTTAGSSFAYKTVGLDVYYHNM